MMAELSAKDSEIQELNAEGQLTAVFRYDAGTRTVQVHHTQSSVSNGVSSLRRLMDVFLPAGYPSSVTPDYTPYQIYDTLQAFASTIAGLLASRAVLVGMGVGDEQASLVTTMLLYIAQETIGRFATILFAHRFSQRIEAEVKFYRFFADIVNDTAFVLDCLSPGLPVLGRLCALCVSNACRAVCGVAGGSSKAILSAHFAKAGNIGELNAKDGSQETVVSLVGMWLGGLVISKVQGAFETWCCLIPLLMLHLWANWKAVKSVRLTSLNTERATILFGALLQGRDISLDKVGEHEPILGLSRIFSLQPKLFQAGVSVTAFLRALPEAVTTTESRQYAALVGLLKVFQDEDYLLWFNRETHQGVVLLKDTSTNETQAKSFCHFLRVSAQTQQLQGKPKGSQQANYLKQGQRPLTSDEDSIQTTGKEDVGIRSQASSERQNSDRMHHHEPLCESLHRNREEWPKVREQIERAGWDLSLTNLVGGRYHRIRTNDSPFDTKKDQ
ncbi:hypothetical protein H2200_007629 [Cladophialophora chaetospira]|uniref:Protein root UVB sensitive/RUS domain-containing protein n=1 Tax=Cladophialophora chaetospira TaxID=386627 RepID=A0AA38X680_9EURO|nr:hypothetical protein H2200_007629 [Cladophialophora chaetospira]